MRPDTHSSNRTRGGRPGTALHRSLAATRVRRQRAGRRWRVTGTDLLPHFADFEVDAFGIDADKLPAALDPSHERVCFAGNLRPNALYDALAERRVYLHLNRWTSLGLSLIQAMLLGLPVVVLDTTNRRELCPVRRVRVPATSTSSSRPLEPSSPTPTRRSVAG